MAGGTQQFKLEIQGLAGLTRALKEYPAISRLILQRAFVGTQAAFAKHTLKGNPVPYRTGFLLASFRFKADTLAARWFPTAAYAPYVEFGTGIYGPRGGLIYPKTARVLSWATGGSTGAYATSASGRRYYKSGAGTAGRVFARYIKGSRAHPFMQSIVDNSTEDVLKLFAQAEDLINAEIAKQSSFN